MKNKKEIIERMNNYLDEKISDNDNVPGSVLLDIRKILKVIEKYELGDKKEKAPVRINSINEISNFMIGEYKSLEYKAFERKNGFSVNVEIEDEIIKIYLEKEGEVISISEYNFEDAVLKEAYLEAVDEGEERLTTTAIEIGDIDIAKIKEFGILMNNELKFGNFYSSLDGLSISDDENLIGGKLLSKDSENIVYVDNFNKESLINYLESKPKEMEMIKEEINDVFEKIKKIEQKYSSESDSLSM